MFFLFAGTGLMLLKYFELGFAAHLSWWWVLSPFAMALVWWAWTDSAGYTKRKAMKAMEQKKQRHLDRQREALGIKSKRSH